MKTGVASRYGWLVLAVMTFLLGGMGSAMAAEEKTTAEKAGTTVEEVSKESAKAVEGFVQRLDESRLRNRSRDELVAWVIIGLLVGSMAGTVTKLGTTGMGRLARVLLGLAGSLVGGMIVRVGEIDLGWAEAVITYEDLLFSAVVAILFVVLGRVIKKQIGKKKSK